ncbi:LXG domain-containing protein [Metabacillus sp. GX 13764]|uniref:LXG domain-containing protein n=1 Tax=Metabacillus kandeliae TaxID=2900151 RepID=UPI001E2DF96C|nr:LXG domain-containing protein [Metabacillus kandeliae]MCD7035986.1 LXG domain-containing protein [Metabacillus kandeliae]
MKVIDVSEVLSAVDHSLTRKKEEKKRVLDVRNALNNVVFLNNSALSGKGGDALRANFREIHLPVIMLINQFLDTYTKELDKVKDIISEFESQNGFIQEDFLVHEIKNGLTSFETAAKSIASSINKELSSVDDLVSASSLSFDELENLIGDAEKQVKDTADELHKTDEKASKSIKDVNDDLTEVARLVSQVKDWGKDGVFLSNDTLTKIEKYFDKNEKLAELLDSALSLSIEQGDSTFLGNIADYLDKASKMVGIKDAGRGALAAVILGSGRIVFEEKGNGKYVIKAADAWKKKNGKYGSKLASLIHSALKQGEKVPLSFISNYFEQFGNSPARVLKKIVGFKPNTTTKSFLTILKESHPFLVFDEAKAAQYGKFPVDVGKTLSQLKVSGWKGVLKRVPYLGIAVSVGTNAGEFISDENKYKSKAEVTGRFAAGLGMDAGVAGLTTGGAFIGTMVCPGVGTVIGGAIGAGIGIASSMALEDKVKEAGGKAGKWLDEKGKELGKKMDEVGKGFQHMVSGLFR